jgi:hypothetical protein
MTFIPGFSAVAHKVGARGGHSGENPRFCYAYWLRLVSFMDRWGFPIPQDGVAELGPGRSFGIGLCALLSGMRSYIALDVQPLHDAKLDRTTLETLIGLFKSREPIPAEKEFPQIQIPVRSLEFPNHVFDPGKLRWALEESNTESLKESLDHVRPNESTPGRITYYAPWQDGDIGSALSAKFLFSRAVMEHVKDPHRVYSGLSFRFNADTIMLHDIEYHSHGLAPTWDGHYRYPQLIWRIIVGRRPYFLNRLTHKDHLAILEKLGFEILGDIRLDPQERSRGGRQAEARKNRKELEFQIAGGIIIVRKNAPQ